MASPNIYTTGVGGTTGDELASFTPLALSGTIWYVLYSSGTDAVSPAGKERIKPLKTLAQAYTNAAAGDAIVLLSGHAETLTAAQTLGKAGLRLISEGTGTSNQASFTKSGSAFDCFQVTAAGVVVANINFPSSGFADTTGSKILIQANGVVIRGCYFSQGANDQYPALVMSSGTPTNCRITNCTIISTATSVASQPNGALLGANNFTDLVMDNVIVDGGSTGWAGTAAINITATATRFTATNIDLLNDSDIAVATGAVYTIHVRNKSGSARLVLAA